MAVIYRFTLRDFDSDLAPALGWNKVMSGLGSIEGNTLSRTVPGSTTDELSGALSSPASGDAPHVTTMAAGTYTASLNVITAGAGVSYKFRLVRVNAAGAVQETLWTSGALTGTGIKTYSAAATPSAGSATDRLQLRLLGSNSNGTGRALAVQLGDPGSYLDTPQAIPLDLITRAVGVCGPFKVGGTYYQIWTAQGCNLFAFSATDPRPHTPGDWTEVDSIQLTALLGDINAYFDGTTVHFVYQADIAPTGTAQPQFLYYATFAGGVFSTPELVHTFAGLGNGEYYPSGKFAVTARSGDVVVGWTEASGGVGAVYYSRRTAPSTWTVKTAVSTTADSLLSSMTLGASDRVHFHYVAPSVKALLHRSLSSANVLDTQSTLATDATYLTTYSDASNGVLTDVGTVIMGVLQTVSFSNQPVLLTYLDQANPPAPTLTTQLSAWAPNLLSMGFDGGVAYFASGSLFDGPRYNFGPGWAQDGLFSVSAPQQLYPTFQPQVYVHNGVQVEAVTYVPWSGDPAISTDYEETTVVSPGSIVVVKHTLTGNGDFDFTGTGAGIDPTFTLPTVAGTATTTFANITPDDDKTITEGLPAAPWAFVSVSCQITVVGSGTSTFSTLGRTASITLGQGDTVTVTYVNTQPQSLFRCIDLDGATLIRGDLTC